MQAAGSVFWLKAADKLGPIRADAAGMTARAERLEGAEGRDVVAIARLHRSAFPFAGPALGV